MATFIVLPNRTCDTGSSAYDFRSHDDTMTMMNLLSRGADRGLSFISNYHHRPALSLSKAPLRQRHDLCRTMRDRRTNRLASRPLRFSPFGHYGDDYEGEEELFGIPVEYLRLLDQFSRDSMKSKSGVKSGEEKCSRGQTNSFCCSANGLPDDTLCMKSQGSTELPRGDKTSDESNKKVDQISNPAATDDPFSISLHLGDYPPDNVNIHVDGRMVNVRAKRDDQDEQGGLVRHSQVTYSFMVPERTRTDTLKSSYGADGMLSITATNENNSTKEIEKSAQPEEMGQSTKEKAGGKKDDSTECASQPSNHDTEIEIPVDVQVLENDSKTVDDAELAHDKE